MNCYTCSITVRSSDERHDPAELGELEREILRIVWTSPEITSESVREQLGRPLKESTVRTALRRLEEKGYVAHREENRTFVYRSAQARGTVAARAVERIVDSVLRWIGRGAAGRNGRSRVLDRKELRSLADKIHPRNEVNNNACSGD